MKFRLNLVIFKTRDNGASVFLLEDLFKVQVSNIFPDKELFIYKFYN